MKINAYQLQHEIFGKVADGISKSELWDDLRQRKEELRHLCAGGNPSHNQYREEMTRVAASIREQWEDATNAGPFGLADMRLRFKAISVAGCICRDILQLSPETITDISDIGDSYQRLTAKITQDSLRDCDLVLDDKYKVLIDELYGAVPTEVPSDAIEATD